MAITKLRESMSGQDAIDRMMEDVQGALLASENEVSDMVTVAYQKRLNELINNLQSIVSQAVDENGNLNQTLWNRLQLKRRTFQLIEDYARGFGDEVISVMDRELANYWREAYNRTAWMLDQGTPTPVEIDYQMPPDSIVRGLISTEWQGAMFSQRLGIITDVMASQIQDKLALSVLQGDSVWEAGKSIRDLVGVPTDQKLVTRPRASAMIYRANMIARTEMIRTANMAQSALYKQNSDLLEGAVWSTKFSGFGVCDDCLDNEGKTIDEIGYEPPEHPNCRCCMAPKLKSLNSLLDEYFDKLPNPPEEQGAYKMNPEDGSYSVTLSQIEDYDEWAEKYLTPTERGE